jgi:hypothetical protein
LISTPVTPEPGYGYPDGVEIGNPHPYP